LQPSDASKNFFAKKMNWFTPAQTSPATLPDPVLPCARDMDLSWPHGRREVFAVPSTPEPRMENKHGNATAFSKFDANQY